jgi:hypothetical protein
MDRLQMPGKGCCWKHHDVVHAREKIGTHHQPECDAIPDHEHPTRKRWERNGQEKQGMKDIAPATE